jgi:hypothetical protein
LSSTPSSPPLRISPSHTPAPSPPISQTTTVGTSRVGIPAHIILRLAAPAPAPTLPRATAARRRSL